MDVLLTILAKTENIAIIVLIGMVAGLGWLHIVWRQEERQDRLRFADALDKNSDALNALRNVLSAVSGKVIQ